MQNLTAFIEAVNSHCAQRGITPATLCGLATGNKRLLPRLMRRAETIERDIERVQRFIAANPPPAGDE